MIRLDIAVLVALIGAAAVFGVGLWARFNIEAERARRAPAAAAGAILVLAAALHIAAVLIGADPGTGLWVLGATARGVGAGWVVCAALVDGVPAAARAIADARSSKSVPGPPAPSGGSQSSSGSQGTHSNQS